MAESPLIASPINHDEIETYGADDMATIASQVASICALINQVPDETTISDSRVALVSAMILHVAGVAATSSTSRRKRRRVDSTRSYEEMCTHGEGTFGVVAKATHRATGQIVALKSLKGRSSVGMLLREACFMAACRGHPNTVALRDIARAPGTSDYSIVMEYVGPTTLHDVLRDRAFTEAEVRGIMRQLLSGAAAMHDHRIIHRDIKPNNIFVGVGAADDADLVVKIGHYGEAMFTAEQDAHGFAGTTPYMAPEMLLDKPDYDTRVDTWSLGCVMAELLNGERLFGSADSATDQSADVDLDAVTNQLYKIFDLLGVPGKKVCREFKSPLSLVTEEVQVWRRGQQQRGRYGSRLHERFPEKTLSKEGFEVLNGLLTCSPSNRLDAAAALRLPWFTDTDGHAPAPVVSKSGGAAASIWALSSCSWQVALACLGYALRSFRPKEVFKS